MFGLLNITKPAGCTSRDVVNRVQHLIKPIKVGHAGTLDPLATGVLVLCIGPATRLIPYIQEMPKQYQATFLLGQSSPSDDTETEITQRTSPPIPTLTDIEEQLPEFIGNIQQVPPTYSAKKIGGKRAYKMVRKGQQVDLKPRNVHVYSLEIIAYEYPRLEMDIRCGSGTYIRSIGRDLAKSLDTAAVMTELTRTSIGEFQIQAGLALDEITPETITSNLQPASKAVEHLPSVTLTDLQIQEIQNGRTIQCAAPAVTSNSSDEIVALDQSGTLVALLKERQQGILGPVRNFTSPV